MFYLVLRYCTNLESPTSQPDTLDWRLSALRSVWLAAVQMAPANKLIPTLSSFPNLKPFAMLRNLVTAYEMIENEGTINGFEAGFPM